MADKPQEDRITDGEPAGRQYNIKNMPAEATAIVRRYALMRGETHADWIARAIYRQAAMEAGDEVIPPPASGALPATEGAPAAEVDLAGLADLVTALTASFQAAGLPVPRTLPRGAHRVLRQAIARALGKPGGKSVGRIGVAGAARPAIEADPQGGVRYSQDAADV